jgi:hypothetical protein
MLAYQRVACAPAVAATARIAGIRKPRSEGRSRRARCPRARRRRPRGFGRRSDPLHLLHRPLMSAAAHASRRAPNRARTDRRRRGAAAPTSRRDRRPRTTRRAPCERQSPRYVAGNDDRGRTADGPDEDPSLQSDLVLVSVITSGSPGRKGRVGHPHLKQDIGQIPRRPGRPRGRDQAARRSTASTAPATAISAARCTPSCSRACSTTPSPAPTPHAARRTARRRAKSSAV